MPNTNSAKKRLRQSLVRRQRNRSMKANVRTEVRKFLDFVRAGTVDAAATQYRRLVRKMDQAAAAHVLHPNRVARRKSRLNKILKSLAQRAA